MRHVFLVAAAAALLLIPALASSAAHTSTRSGHGPLGVIPPQVDGHLAGSWASPRPYDTKAHPSSSGGPTKADNLTYDGGPVMRTNTVYTIFWVPGGYSIPTTYQSTINQYFQDVAADSGFGSNVYSTTQQYGDTTGGISYDSAYGDTALDTQAFPASGCTTPSDVLGTSVCLTDSQLAAEVQRFATFKGWPHGPNTEFFVYTAHNVESCFDTSQDYCSYDYYCAYHNDVFSGGEDDTDPADEYIYANMPYPNQDVQVGDTVYQSYCYSGDFPNSADPNNLDDDAADEVINVSSHEHNESITDPLGDAWWVDNPDSAYYGSENGDLCAWYFPTRAKSSGSPAIGSGSAYDQVINGHHYFVQGEWSNKNATSSANSGCMWSFGYPTESTTATITGTATVGQVLTGDAGSWTGSPTSYKFEWLRCDSSGDNCSLAKSVTSGTDSAAYTLVSADDKHTMRVRVTAGSASGLGAPATSDATSVVDGEPVLTAIPTIVGTTDVGQTLTATDLGTWSPAATSYKVSWLRCDNAGNNCKALKSATVTSPPATYALTKADDKMTIRLQVTATNSAGVSDTYVGDANGPIGGEPESTGGGPAIGGTAAVGSTLTGDVGSWTHTPTSYSFTWLRCNGTCKVIRKGTLKAPATTTTYVPTKADDRMTIEFQVTASNASGVGDMVFDQTGTVTGEPASGTAGVTGTATVGQTLTATTGSWSPAATKYKYDWLRCDAGGNNCTAIKSVSVTTTTTTYRLATADATHTIRVRVTASNAAGSSDPVQSTATSTVGR